MAQGPASAAALEAILVLGDRVGLWLETLALADIQHDGVGRGALLHGVLGDHLPVIEHPAPRATAGVKTGHRTFTGCKEDMSAPPHQRCGKVEHKI